VSFGQTRAEFTNQKWILDSNFQNTYNYEPYSRNKYYGDDYQFEFSYDRFTSEDGYVKSVKTSLKAYSSPTSHHYDWFMGNIRQVSIMYPYNNKNNGYSEFEYRDGYLFYEKNTMGEYYEEIPDSNNRKVITVLDGFYRIYNYKSRQVYFEAYYINNYQISQKNNATFKANYPDIQTYIRDFSKIYFDKNIVEEYDLEAMINVFLENYINNYIKIGLPENKVVQIPLFIEEFKNMFNIKATFVPLENDALALAYGFNDDKNIILKVDPEKWAKASSAKRWYTLYHELGHDVLNFEHGQGGKMMFNFADRDYTWETFEKDRNYMFKKAIENAKKRNKLF
jgi:hypothetical protein